MTIKKRTEGGGETTAAKKTAKRAAPPRAAPRRAAPTPRIHASHAEAAKPAARRSRAPGPGGAGRLTPARKLPGAPRKAPLAAPKRAVPRKAPPIEAVPSPSSAARDLALKLAAAAIDKKAIGIEILDVTGKVDYADFLLVMTGRSDRHVHSIATGIEEALRRAGHAPLSVEGLTSATWVLIDFGDVVVHVFQEDARAVYDIEGLWIDAGRVPVPDADKAEGATPAPRPRPGD